MLVEDEKNQVLGSVLTVAEGWCTNFLRTTYMLAKNCKFVFMYKFLKISGNFHVFLYNLLKNYEVCMYAQTSWIYKLMLTYVNLVRELNFITFRKWNHNI